MPNAKDQAPKFAVISFALVISVPPEPLFR
jgi:hypothetical protein